MDNDETSSSSDEFDLSSMSSIQDALDYETHESSGEDIDQVKDTRRRKVRIIDSESETESETAEDGSSSEWVLCNEYEEVPPTAQFIPGEHPTGPRINSNTKEPVDFFKLFFTNELVEKIVSETNNYAKTKLEGQTLSANSIWRNWHDVENAEFWAFIAVVINMGTMPLANLQEYWSKDSTSYIPFYSDTFTRDRFSQIFWMLHLTTISTCSTNPRTRLQRGHHMYTNSYYTSYTLAQELAKLKCHITGTISRNRKQLPSVIKKPKFLKKSTVVYRRGNALLLAWKDKRTVTCLTTRDNTGMRTVKRTERNGAEIIMKKPNIILNYIKYMGGVNRADQYALTYCFLQNRLKWWRMLFFWGMEVCLINSYLLYKSEKKRRGEKPKNHLRFFKMLVEQLRGSYRQHRQHASTSFSDEPRLNGKLHILRKGAKRDCKVCSDRNKPGGRREISYYCDTCPDKPRMHLGECFIKYHTKANYRM